MILDASITISRPSGDSCNYISITVVDKKCSCEFIELQIPYSEFAQALTGLSRIDCVANFRENAPIGKKREHKFVIVKCPDYANIEDREKREKAARKVFAEFEVDGWKGNVDDAFNHHNWCGKNEVRVGFVRYV